jgi:hypothetical protein
MPYSQWEHVVMSDQIEVCKYVVVSVYPFPRILGLSHDKPRAEEIARSEKAGAINIIAKINGIRYK